MKAPRFTAQPLLQPRVLTLGAYAVLACLGWWLTYRACYPGLMTPDSVSQFEQATTFEFDDWHPPVMAGLWALAMVFAPGPASLFLPIITLYWGALFLVAAALLRWSRPASGFAAVLGFSPVLINFAGTLWKDVLVFVCLMMVSGLLLSVHGRERRPAIVVALCVIFGLIAGLARHNSMLAVAPLLMLLMFPADLPERALGQLIQRLAIALALAVFVVTAAQASLNALIFHPRKSGVANSLLLFDMVGVSAITGNNVVPGRWTRKESRRIVRKCYEPAKWDGLAFGKCSFVARRLEQCGKWKAGLFADWRRVLAGHPVAYLQHRLNHMWTLAWRPNLFFVGYAEQTAVDWGFSENRYYQAMYDLMDVPGPVLAMAYKPGLWLLFSTALLVWTGAAALRRRQLAYPAFCLALSGFLYWTPLTLIGVANDFRYVYWTIGASLVSLFVMVAGAACSRKGEAGRP